MKKVLLYGAAMLLSVGFLKAQNVIDRSLNRSTKVSEVELSEIVHSKSGLAVKEISEADQPTYTVTKQGAIAPEDVLYSIDFQEEAARAEWSSYDIDQLDLANDLGKGAWSPSYEASGSTNIVMVSQSWFAAPAVADDWLLSPAVAIPADGKFAFNWEARASNVSFPDGYEVRVAVVADFDAMLAAFPEDGTLADLSAAFVGASEKVFSVVNENADWTSRMITLDAKYNGKNIYVIWRNNSNDCDKLMLDNVTVYRMPQFAASAIFTGLPFVGYTQMPEFLKFNLGGIIKARVTNNGSSAISNAALEVVQYENDNDIDHETVNFASVAASTVVDFETTKPYLFTPIAGKANSYVFSLSLASDQAEIADYIESAVIEGPLVTTDILARDNGVRKGSLSVDASLDNPKKIGMAFYLDANTVIEQVMFNLVNPTVTETTVSIYNSQLSLVAKSAPIAVSSGVDATYTATFENGGVGVESGSYVIALDEANLQGLTLEQTTNAIGSSVYYDAGSGWKGPLTFTLSIRLKVKEGSATSVEFPEKASFAVSAIANELFVNGGSIGSVAEVYNVSGQTVASVVLNSERQSLGHFNGGLYIVKIADERVKVIVR